MKDLGTNAGDPWGQDPRVRELRRVFAAMEEGEAQLLGRLCIGSLDPRLRRWREKARVEFEGRWAATVRRGEGLGPGGVASVYVECLAEAVAGRGGPV